MAEPRGRSREWLPPLAENKASGNQRRMQPRLREDSNSDDFESLNKKRRTQRDQGDRSETSFSVEKEDLSHLVHSYPSLRDEKASGLRVTKVAFAPWGQRMKDGGGTKSSWQEPKKPQVFVYVQIVENTDPQRTSREDEATEDSEVQVVCVKKPLAAPMTQEGGHREMQNGSGAERPNSWRLSPLARQALLEGRWLSLDEANCICPCATAGALLRVHLDSQKQNPLNPSW